MPVTSMAAAMMALCLLGAGPDWASTFPPATVGSYAGEGTTGVLVSAAGDPSPDRDAAARAVIAALRASGRASLVMDDSSIGSTAGLSDAQIVEKCQALPVQRVMVVRVFPGASGAPPNAVMTVYDKQAAALSAVAAVPGTPVAAFQAPATAPPASPEHLRDDRTARRLYNERAIRIESVTVTNENGYPVASEGVAYQGKTLLSTQDMLMRVGRKDLAQDMEARLALRGTLAIGGILTSMAGVAMLPFALLGSCTTKSARTLECVRHDYTWVAVGGGMAVGGLVLWAVGVNLPMPVSSGSMRQMADDYNDQLLKDLGLSPVSSPAPEGGTLRLSLAPNGLALSGTF